MKYLNSLKNKKNLHINKRGSKINLSSNHLVHTGTYLDRRPTLIINEIVNSLRYLAAQVRICLSEEKKNVITLGK